MDSLLFSEQGGRVSVGKERCVDENGVEVEPRTHHQEGGGVYIRIGDVMKWAGQCLKMKTVIFLYTIKNATFRGSL